MLNCRNGPNCASMGLAQEALVGVRHNLTLCRRHQLNDLGWGRLEQGRYAEAIDYLRSALPLSLGAQRGRLEGDIEGNCGTARLGQGHYEQALGHLERSQTLRRQTGDWRSEPYVLGQIAQARQGMGSHSEVIALCEHALSIEPDLIYPPVAAAILNPFGMSLQHIGDMDRAVSCWREALKIFDRFGDPRAAEVRARLAGQLGVVAGQPVLGAHEDADHAFGGAGGAFDVGVGAFGAEVAAGEGPALLDGDGVLDRGDRSLG
jgi:tetratricopeptide (TPR) repeat protein